MEFKRTPEELIYDIENCTGPCGELCYSCPESHGLLEIKEIIQDLINERNMYKSKAEEQSK